MIWKRPILTYSTLAACMLCFCANAGQAGQIFSCSSDSENSANNGVNNRDKIDENNQDHNQEAIEFQALNCYLTKLDLFSLDAADVVPHLKAAIDVIKSLGIDEFSKLDTEGTDLDIKFKPLLGNNSRIVLSTLQQLVSASTSCSQESLNFLTLIVEQQTFDGQVLNEYARELLAKCWIEDLNSMPKKIEQRVGKMATTLFELIAKLAKREYNSREREQTPRGSIVINDLEPPRMLQDRLEQLKQVTFDTDKQVRMFAQAIFDHFKEEQELSEGSFPARSWLSKLEEFYNVTLVAPCSELVDRMRSVLWKLGLSSRYSPDNTDESIERKRLENKELDHKLEMYRICKQVRSKDGSIWTTLSRIRPKVRASV